MKIQRSILFAVLFISVYIITPTLSYSGSEDPNKETLINLINELESAVNSADKKMVAHPNFIKELRGLIEKYRGKFRTVFLKENFSDGDYIKNPKWDVVSGQFEITPSKRLRSSVVSERPVEKPATEEKKDLFGMLLKEVLKPSSDIQEEKSSPAKIKEASIHTNVEIGPVFELDISMISNSKWGSMELVLLGGKKRVPYYRLVYNASPSPDRPIQFFRERGLRSYLIDEATKYPLLDDGNLHKIQWIRDLQGNIKVLVDGKEILSTVDVFYKDNFTGFTIVNRGGTYEWGPINIFEASDK